MKCVATGCYVLIIGALLVSGTSAVAETGVVVGFELNKINFIKYELDASSADFTLGSTLSTLESDNESVTLKGEEALLRIGVRMSPAIEFHGIIGNSKSSGFIESNNGFLFGAGVAAAPPSSSSWKSSIALEITHSSAKDNGFSQALRAYSDDGVTSQYVSGTGTGSAEIQLTKIDLSALAINKIGFTEPYIGLMYSIVSGTLDTKLRGTASVQTCSTTCSSSNTPFTIDELRDVSLDSQIGLTIGFNAHAADAMTMGFGAIFGTRTQYTAHLEYAF